MANVNQNIKLLNDFNLLLIDDPSTAEHYQPSDYDLAV